MSLQPLRLLVQADYKRAFVRVAAAFTNQTGMGVEPTYVSADYQDVAGPQYNVLTGALPPSCCLTRPVVLCVCAQPQQCMQFHAHTVAMQVADVSPTSADSLRTLGASCVSLGDGPMAGFSCTLVSCACPVSSRC